MIKSFRNKALNTLFETGKAAKIDANMHKRILARLARLARLDVAERPEDMNLPGFDFHALKGFKPTRYTVHVNGPWCITFAFDGKDAVHVDFEQYHYAMEVEMKTYEPRRPLERCPSHPGSVLDDIIPATGKTKVEIARLLGISRQQLYDILRERKPVSPQTAVRLGKLFGDGPGIWLRMQAAYDAWHAEREVDVSNIPTIKAA